MITLSTPKGYVQKILCSAEIQYIYISVWISEQRVIIYLHRTKCFQDAGGGGQSRSPEKEIM
jgi:hypothetical protein